MEDGVAAEPLSEEGFADLSNRLDEGSEMIRSPGYLAIAHPRTEALARSELHPLDR